MNLASSCDISLLVIAPENLNFLLIHIILLTIPSFYACSADFMSIISIFSVPGTFLIGTLNRTALSISLVIFNVLLMFISGHVTII